MRVTGTSDVRVQVHQLKLMAMSCEDLDEGMATEEDGGDRAGMAQDEDRLSVSSLVAELQQGISDFQAGLHAGVMPVEMS